VNKKFAEVTSKRERGRERPGLGVALKEVNGGEQRAEAIEREPVVRLKKSIRFFFSLCGLIYWLRRHVADNRARG
jgi:hypothetical protein